MKAEEYKEYDGLGLAELVRNKEVSSLELAETVKGLIAEENPKINAVIEVFDEPVPAIDKAQDGPFKGVPFLVKDSVVQIEGKKSEMGSRMAAGLTAAGDSFLMTRFKEAGLLTMGRTTTPEFGYNVTGESVFNGPTRNPYNTTYSAGGSSAGAAAVVAAGILPIAHGNDGGGSIRIPASCCGLVGLKPTRARTPNGPGVGEGLSGFGVDFALAQTVRDTATLLDATLGSVEGDPYHIEKPSKPYAQSCNEELKPLRIGFIEQSWTGAKTDSELVDALGKTAAQCEALGHHVSPAKLELDAESFEQAVLRVNAANTAFLIDLLSKIMDRPIDENYCEATSLAVYEHGKSMSSNDFFEATAAINVATRSVADFYSDYDLILSPTLAKTPMKIGEYNANEKGLSALEWTRKIFDFAAFTALFNATGQPAISLPLQTSSQGLPLGMQFVARFGDEQTLLQLARQFELAYPWQRYCEQVNVTHS